MKIEYHKPAGHEPVMDSEVSDFQLNQFESVETKEIDLGSKLLEYISYLDEDHRDVKRIIMHHRLFNALKRTSEFQRSMEYSGVVDHDPEHLRFYGVEIVPMRLGDRSIDDFIIITESKTLHSDMIEKDFIQDLDVEEVLKETNDMIEEREVNNE